jgi:hypothetical protein
MKNVVKLFGIITLVAIIGLSIASCSKGGGSGGGGGKIPNGTYETADGYTSFTFKGNQMTITREGKVMTESAYEIQDGKIWYTGYGGEKDDLDYKLDGNVLTIGVSKYTKK